MRYSQLKINTQNEIAKYLLELYTMAYFKIIPFLLLSGYLNDKIVYFTI